MKIAGKRVGNRGYNRAELTRAELTQTDLTRGRVDPHSLSAWFPKSEVLRDPVGPVCARYHQQPGWHCESWTKADRFDHNGFRKGL